MAFYLVRIGPHDDFVCYGPDSRQACMKEMAAVKAMNDKFYPGSTTELYMDAPRVSRRKKEPEPEAEAPHDMVDELLNLGGKIE